MSNRIIDLFAFGFLAACIPLALINTWIWLFINPTIGWAITINIIILILSGLLILVGNSEPSNKAIASMPANQPKAQITTAEFRLLPRYDSAADFKPKKKTHIGVGNLEFDDHGNLA